MHAAAVFTFSHGTDKDVSAHRCHFSPQSLRNSFKKGIPQTLRGEVAKFAEFLQKRCVEQWFSASECYAAACRQKVQLVDLYLLIQLPDRHVGTLCIQGKGERIDAPFTAQRTAMKTMIDIIFSIFFTIRMNSCQASCIRRPPLCVRG